METYGTFEKDYQKGISRTEQRLNIHKYYKGKIPIEVMRGCCWCAWENCPGETDKTTNCDLSEQRRRDGRWPEKGIKLPLPPKGRPKKRLSSLE